MSTRTSSDKIIYFYHGVVNKNTYLIPRLISSLIRLPLFKSLFFIFPGIDQAISLQKGSVKEGESNEFAVEINPSMLGVFNRSWEVKQKVVDKIKQVGAKYVSFHAPYVDDGVIFQKASQTMLDNTFDLSEDSSKTLFCLVSHLQFIDQVGPEKKDKVLVVHPLPASPYKNEHEIIKGIATVLKKVTPLLEDLNIFVAIENMPWMKKKHERYTSMLGSISFFERLMNEINHPNVGITFDWGHANCFSRYMHDHKLADGAFTFTEKDLTTFAYHKKFLTDLQQKIMHLHLHYNEAHILTSKAPFYAKNYDYHADLTKLRPEEYPFYKESLQPALGSPVLKSIVLETVPSFLSQQSRLTKYKDSVEILKSMVE
ncbi:MAG: TIM barrel protein [Candidatus Dojkabacteria bacterium]|nr:MAG: TIM barrel protein [Candidatus Dojkabacteria bacterium]